MPVNVVYDHEKEENKEMKLVQGQQKKEYDQNAGLYDAFQGMKSIGGPGGRVGRLVMHEMHDLEKSRVMHESMRPIEIGIVYKQE
jgi:hypothetical protein